MDMDVNKLDGGQTCIRLNGRLDAPGADHVGVRFTAAAVAGGHDTIVDLSGVSFLGSMGIRLLISSARALHAKHAKLVLFGAKEFVQDVLDQSALGQIMPVVTTEQQAIEQLGA